MWYLLGLISCGSLAYAYKSKPLGYIALIPIVNLILVMLYLAGLAEEKVKQKYPR